MRLLIAELYKLLFRITGHRLFSLCFSLAYISTLNLIVIYGICVLLKDSSPLAMQALRFFTLGHVVMAAIVMILIDFLFVLPLRYLSVIPRRHMALAPLLVYSFVSILLVLYSRMF